MRNLITFTTSLLLLTGCYQQPQSNAAGAPPPPNPAAMSAPAPATPSMPPSEVGRFVIVHSPHIQRDTVLLDTETGQTWILVQLTDVNDEPAEWEPMFRLPEDYAKIVAQYGLKSRRGQSTAASIDAGTAATPSTGDGSATRSQQ